MKRYITPAIFQVVSTADTFLQSSTKTIPTTDTSADPDKDVLGKKGMWDSMDDDDK